MIKERERERKRICDTFEDVKKFGKALWSLGSSFVTWCRASIAPSSAGRPAEGGERRTAGVAAVRRQGVGGGRVGQVHVASGPYMQLAGKCIAGGDAGRAAARERKREGEGRERGRVTGGGGECTHKVDI